MFELWGLRRKQAKLLKRMLREVQDMVRTQTAPALGSLTERNRQFKEVDDAIQDIYDQRLLREAEALDIEPPVDESAWKPGAEVDFLRQLTPSGRTFLRRRIDEEKTRRREVDAWWWKNVLIPAMTALTGLAGVITGLIAVLHAKK